ncbi:MAG: hypothetical protein HY272_02015 [Gammaproteobacteria bacterium]|nr:hypothetical protein [Gammaproteobacteria bacterium]
MATFPSTGKLLFNGFAEQRQPAVVRTEMDSGPPKQTKKLSRVMITRPVTYLFAAADYASFLTWFETTINNGNDWFDWTDPRTSTVKQARIVGGQLDEARPRNGKLTYWTVSFKLETWQ